MGRIKAYQLTSGIIMKFVLLVVILVPTIICIPQALPPRRDFVLFSRDNFRDFQNIGSNGISLGPINPSAAATTAAGVDLSSRGTFSSASSSVSQQQPLQFQSSFSSPLEGSTLSALPSISTTRKSVSEGSISNVSPTAVQLNVTDGIIEIVNVSDSFSLDNSTDSEKVIVPPVATQSKISTYSQIFQHTLVWLNDTYVLSILIPVCIGFVFASVVIVTVATCRCIRRRLLRQRLRSKILPESIKNMRRSDRTRLLAESSDEEF